MALNMTVAGPSQCVTFFRSDVVGSTEKFERANAAMQRAMKRLDRLLKETLARHHGEWRQWNQGDDCFAWFDGPSDAARAALEFTEVLDKADWSELPEPLRVRIALYTGDDAEKVDHDWLGTSPNRCQRLQEIARPGQILCSEATGTLLKHAPGVELLPFGEVQLRDASRENVFLLSSGAIVPNRQPPASLDLTKNNLPRHLKGLVGRADELRSVVEDLASSRLVTLSGVGGVGKSRLAVRVAAEVTPAGPTADGDAAGRRQRRDGAWLIELSSLTDRSQRGVARELAHVLRGIDAQAARLQAGREDLLVDRVAQYLARKEMLIVFDNCEKVRKPVAKLVTRLLEALGLWVLTTSREPLGATWLRNRREVVFRVPCLTAPAAGLPPDPGELRKFDAVELFVERVRDVDRDFAITADTADHVASICASLDGLPYAIELAAPYVPNFSAKWLSDQLGNDRRFQLLVSGPREPPHHRTLRKVMDWSYDLLTEPERRLLRRLSAFAGGFSLDAVERVGGGGGDDRVDRTLSQLVTKSLVLKADTQLRYRLLETVREFAHEKLERSGESDDVNDRHLAWAVDLAELFAADMVRANSMSPEWLDRLDLERDNFRKALEWAFHGPSDGGPRLAASLHPFWSLRHHLDDGDRWLTKALERPVSTALEARLRHGAANIARARGRIHRARRLFEQALKAARTADNDSEICAALANLAELAERDGDLVRARKRWAQLLKKCPGLPDEDSWNARAALGLAKLRALAPAEGGNDAGLIRALGNLASTTGAAATATFARLARSGAAVEQGDERNWAELEADDRVRRDPAFRAEYLTQGANLALAEGDRDAAQRRLDRAMQSARASGDDHVVAGVLHGAARLERLRGQFDRARDLESQSLTLRDKIGEKLGIAECLEALAGLWAESSDHRRAARLFGAADDLRVRLGASPAPSAQRIRDDDKRRVQDALGEDAFWLEWECGIQLNVDRAGRLNLHRAVEEALRRP